MDLCMYVYLYLLLAAVKFNKVFQFDLKNNLCRKKSIIDLLLILIRFGINELTTLPKDYQSSALDKHLYRQVTRVFVV